MFRLYLTAQAVDVNMNKSLINYRLEKDCTFFVLLRYALGISQELPDAISDDEWNTLYKLSQEQTLSGIVYAAIQRLPEPLLPNEMLLFQWFSNARHIAKTNQKVTEEAVRWTEWFAQQGHKSCILKGQANARLYPDPTTRTSGDVDIWVEGGEKKVTELLEKAGKIDETTTFSTYDIHLMPKERDGVDIEVHFLPSAGNSNPKTTPYLLNYLDKELATLTLCPEGFYMPTMKFCLAMQLAHIQSHFLTEGISLRQLMDYYMLLCHSTEQERNEIREHLKPMGLYNMATAVMWVLSEMLMLDEQQMLMPANKKRGTILLGGIMKGGNFGRYSPRWETGSFLRRNIVYAHDKMNMAMQFPEEVLWSEIGRWRSFFETIPERIQKRQWALR